MVGMHAGGGARRATRVFYTRDLPPPWRQLLPRVLAAGQRAVQRRRGRRRVPGKRRRPARRRRGMMGRRRRRWPWRRRQGQRAEAARELAVLPYGKGRRSAVARAPRGALLEPRRVLALSAHRRLSRWVDAWACAAGQRARGEQRHLLGLGVAQNLVRDVAVHALPPRAVEARLEGEHGIVAARAAGRHGIDGWRRHWRTTRRQRRAPRSYHSSYPSDHRLRACS